MKAIKAVKPGMRYADVGGIVSAHAKANGFSVVKTYCGHGICEHFHCAPTVPHYAKNKAKGTMQVHCCDTLMNALKRWCQDGPSRHACFTLDVISMALMLH
jgi:methionine aminopeptidase